VCVFFVRNCVTHVKGRTWTQDIREECAEEITRFKKEDKVEKGEDCEMKTFVICISGRALLR